MQTSGRGQTPTQGPESSPPDQFLGRGHDLGNLMGLPLSQEL